MSENANDVGNVLADLIREGMAERNEIEQRIIANRVRAAIESWIEVKQALPFAPQPMTDIEATRFGEDKMPFGKFAGEPVNCVPLDYLAWLADASRKMWLDLNGYLRSSKIVAEIEQEPTP
ncbi:MAG: DUF3820 family protein [Opitutaceae bacterium]